MGTLANFIKQSTGEEIEFPVYEPSLGTLIQVIIGLRVVMQLSALVKFKAEFMDKDYLPPDLAKPVTEASATVTTVPHQFLPAPNPSRSPKSSDDESDNPKGRATPDPVVAATGLFALTDSLAALQSAAADEMNDGAGDSDVEDDTFDSASRFTRGTKPSENICVWNPSCLFRSFILSTFFRTVGYFARPNSRCLPFRLSLRRIIQSHFVFVRREAYCHESSTIIE